MDIEVVMVVEPIIYLVAPPQGTNIYITFFWFNSFNVTFNPKGSMDANLVIL
jgi:hypothetical protein